MTLSTELKVGTKKSHNAAENTKFVSQFLKGVLNPEEYRKLITDFYYVYETMEERIQESKDPLVQPLKQWNAKLFRTAFLNRDLRYYYGPMYRSMLIPSEACNTYCYRINEIAEKDPYLLIAHHYTRYIGDLSGGQILKGIAQKALNPPKGEGLHFYDFPMIDDAKAFKTDYRAVLDGLEVNEHQVNTLISEANYAFRLNMYMFDELQGDASKGLLKVLWGVITGK
ncbi:MAG: heme oxygenase [Euryarchaeota archaeon]|mgnify:FL=1|nr:heme oxygenase [Euryarchaeota archaeon]|tara:strand:- start:1327 stop:2004 length:678 start_codon:yes stop_codon:yes gene_type:complete